MSQFVCEKLIHVFAVISQHSNHLLNLTPGKWIMAELVEIHVHVYSLCIIPLYLYGEHEFDALLKKNKYPSQSDCTIVTAQEPMHHGVTAHYNSYCMYNSSTKLLGEI